MTLCICALKKSTQYSLRLLDIAVKVIIDSDSPEKTKVIYGLLIKKSVSRHVLYHQTLEASNTRKSIFALKSFKWTNN